jgi:hypothetical protein
MKAKLIMIPIILFLSSALLTGCFGVDREFCLVRDSILSQFANRLYTDLEFSIGSVGLSLAGSMVSLADDTEEVTEMLSAISGVQVGIYKNKNRERTKGGFAYLKKLDGKLRKSGWKNIIKNIDSGEITGVYIKDDNFNPLTAMFVINFDKNELVLVKLEGEIDKLIEYSLANRKLDVVFN